MIYTQSYATVHELQRHRAANAPDENAIELRARLKQQDALLFAAYMEVLNARPG